MDENTAPPDLPRQFAQWRQVLTDPFDNAARDELRHLGVPVEGVFVGGCLTRGVGSSFRAMAHTHTVTEPLGWICVRSGKRVWTPSGKPSRLLLHEAAHVLAPKAKHGSATFIRALAQVGIKTDSYSRAGRQRAAR